MSTEVGYRPPDVEGERDDNNPRVATPVKPARVRMPRWVRPALLGLAATSAAIAGPVTSEIRAKYFPSDPSGLVTPGIPAGSGISGFSNVESAPPIPFESGVEVLDSSLYRINAGEIPVLSTPFEPVSAWKVGEREAMNAAGLGKDPEFVRKDWEDEGVNFVNKFMEKYQSEFVGAFQSKTGLKINLFLNTQNADDIATVNIEEMDSLIGLIFQKNENLSEGNSYKDAVQAVSQRAQKGELYDTIVNIVLATARDSCIGSSGIVDDGFFKAKNWDQCIGQGITSAYDTLTESSLPQKYLASVIVRAPGTQNSIPEISSRQTTFTHELIHAAVSMAGRTANYNSANLATGPEHEYVHALMRAVGESSSNNNNFVFGFQPVCQVPNSLNKYSLPKRNFTGAVLRLV